ncbi:type II toxin-antitoxin system RelE/ParE family toxin [Brucella pseudogrignonensis]
MKTIWSKTATEAFDVIIDYVAEDSEAAAEKLVDVIHEKVAGLKAFPSLYKTGRVAGTREMSVGNYIVVYSVIDDLITVNTVLHGAQQYP